MKTTKKVLGLLLALCLVVSGMTVGFYALAAETDDPVAAAAVAITAMSANKTNIAVKTPTDETKLAAYNEKLALYDAAVAAYKVLTPEQKDAFDVKMTLDMWKQFSEREGFLIKDAFDSQLPEGSTWKEQMPLADARAQANQMMDDRLGVHPARTATLELGDKYLGTKVALSDGSSLNLSSNSNFEKYPELKEQAKAYLSAYLAAPQLVRMYLDGYNGTFKSFSNNTIGFAFKEAVLMQGKIEYAENPFTEEAPPSTGTKPKDSNYADGVNDPEYIAALNAYLEKKQAVMAYNQRKSLYQYNMYIEAMKEISETVTEAKPATEVVLKLLAGYIEFDTTGSVEKAKEGMAAYEAMTDAFDMAVYKSMAPIYVYYTFSLNGAKNDYTYSNLNVSQLYKKCEETAGMEILAEFEEWLATVDLETVDNAVVALAQEKYKDVPYSVRSKISEDASAKYDEIIKRYDPVDPLTPSDYKFDSEIAEFKTLNTGIAEFPVIKQFNAAKIGFENKLITEIYKIAIEKLTGSDTLITNKNVSVVGSLYDLIANANLVTSGINVSNVLANEFTPSKLAGFLEEEKFAGAKAKLLAASEINDTTSAYADIVFENGDWGFADGDEAGFAAALAAALRPASNVIHNGVLIISNVIYLPNSYASNGDYVYGAYEELIPLLEGLGLDGVISSQEYTNRFHKAIQGNKYDYLDSLLLPVLEPVVGLVTELEDNVLNTLIKILPNAAKMIDENLITTYLDNFLNKSSLLSSIEIDLSADAINAMIDGNVISVPLGDRFSLSFTLRAVDWNKLSRCGKLEAVSSATAANAYRPYVKADKVKVRAVMSGYIKDVIFSVKFANTSSQIAINF